MNRQNRLGRGASQAFSRTVILWTVIPWTAILSLLPILTWGCAARKSDKVEGQVGENLSTIANAYQQATVKNNRPPSGPDELKPFLPANQDSDTLFRSIRDHEPFVIIWGTDPRAGMDLKPLVIGYEKQGQGGTRMVFTAMGVMTMEDHGFAAARFPAGHKP